MYLCRFSYLMFIDVHTHRVHSADIPIIYNIRINDDAVALPHDRHIYFSAGIHPWDAGKVRSVWFDNMTILLNYKQVIAVGECGLDKNTSVSFEKQLEIFEKHIHLSEINRLPLLIHCVGFSHEIIRLHQSVKPEQAWIIHGFRGKPDLALQFLKEGIYLSFGEKFNIESVKVTPIDRILIETDESEIPIEDLYQRIAEIKGCHVKDLKAAHDVFGI